MNLHGVEPHVIRAIARRIADDVQLDSAMVRGESVARPGPRALGRLRYLTETLVANKLSRGESVVLGAFYGRPTGDLAELLSEAGTTPASAARGSTTFPGVALSSAAIYSLHADQETGAPRFAYTYGSQQDRKLLLPLELSVARIVESHSGKPAAGPSVLTSQGPIPVSQQEPIACFIGDVSARTLRFLGANKRPPTFGGSQADVDLVQAGIAAQLDDGAMAVLRGLEFKPTNSGWESNAAQNGSLAPSGTTIVDPSAVPSCVTNDFFSPVDVPLDPRERIGAAVATVASRAAATSVSPLSPVGDPLCRFLDATYGSAGGKKALSDAQGAQFEASLYVEYADRGSSGRPEYPIEGSPSEEREIAERAGLAMYPHPNVCFSISPLPDAKGEVVVAASRAEDVLLFHVSDGGVDVSRYPSSFFTGISSKSQLGPPIAHFDLPQMSLENGRAPEGGRPGAPLLT